MAHLYRDWSAETDRLRRRTYRGLLSALTRRYPVPSQRHGVRVLVPGAGLARLAYEIASLGFTTVGAEASPAMVAAARSVLGHCCAGARVNATATPGSGSQDGERGGAAGVYASVDCVAGRQLWRCLQLRRRSVRVCPFATTTSNLGSWRDREHCVAVPDVAPSPCLPLTLRRQTLAAVLRDVECGAVPPFDVVVSLYFVDVPVDPVSTVRQVVRVLRPEGGMWLNFGPLQYHHRIDGSPDVAGTDGASSDGPRQPDGDDTTSAAGGVHLSAEQLHALISNWRCDTSEAVVRRWALVGCEYVPLPATSLARPASGSQSSWVGGQCIEWQVELKGSCPSRSPSPRGNGASAEPSFKV